MSQSGHGPGGSNWSMLIPTGQMSDSSSQGQRVRTVDERSGRKAEASRGAALVEFTFVAGLLFLLLFGIIGFGVVLSFKQTLTHAAAEGARRAATTQDDPLTTADERLEVADSAIKEFEGWGRDCFDMDVCTIAIHDCNSLSQTAAIPDCVTVTLVYDYAGNPIVPELPLVGGFMPDTVETSATSQLSFPGP